MAVRPSRLVGLSYGYALLVLVGILLPARAAESPVFPVGVAVVDITPEYPIRLSGYGGRRTPSEGIEQRLYAKALAFGTAERGDLSVLLTVDNTGIPGAMTEAVWKRLAAELPLKRSQFALCSSHTHTGPMLKGILPNLFSQDLPPEQWEIVERYTDELTEKLVEVCRQAVRQPVPSEIWWGRGRASFARNRRPGGGPVDHDLPVLAVKAVAGSWQALLVNYACHCTTLGGDFNRQCGDWAGYAQEAIERQMPGLRALVAIGCGADSDPYPRGPVSQAQQHGQEIADQVERLLGGHLQRVQALPQGELRRLDLAFEPLPTRATWKERSGQPGITGYHARRNLERLDRGEALPTELPYSVQAWAFGDDLAMVFLPGEVVVDYALRLKSEFDRRRMWVNAYANDVPCYIPSARIWDEGGYEGGGAMPYYDRPTRLARDTEERIFAQLQQVIPASFKASAEVSEVTQPQTPAQALKSFHVASGLKVDLIAAEPLVIDPVAVDFGPDGRLWVAEMHDYPSGLDGNFQPGGRISVLTDTDGDGTFDRVQRLADDVPFPTGVMAWKQGVLVCAAPEILYLEDTDHDGRADIRRTLFSGFATHNYQARVNSLRWGLDGWVYGAAGLFGGTIRSHLTGQDHELSGRDFRMRPDTGEFEAVSGLSQQGRARDDFGNAFGCDNGTWMWHFPFPDRYLARNPGLSVSGSRVHVAAGADANRVYPTSPTLERFNDPEAAERTTSACGLEVFRDLRLGPELYHNAFIAEPVHNLVHRLVVQPSGTTFTGTRAPEEARSEFLSSSDNWFRPVELRTGPDGTLWVVDMYRFLIEHPRWITPERLVQLDPRAGDQLGRLYRIQKQGATNPPTWGDLTQRSTADLVQLLGQDNGVLRDLAHRLLVERKDATALPGIQSLVRGSQGPGARAQALFVLDQLGGLTEALVLEALTDRDPAVRRAAIELSEARVGSVKAVADRWQERVEDSDPMVRMQLAFSLGEWHAPEAGTALARLMVKDGADPRMRVAVLSSAATHAPRLLAAVLEQPVNSPERRAWVKDLVATTARAGDAASRAAVLPLILPADTEPLDEWHLATVAALIEAGTPEERAALSPRLGRVWTEARRWAGDPARDFVGRQTALRLLAQGPLSAEDLNQLGEVLNRPSDLELAKSALAGLKQSGHPQAAPILLNDWEAKPLALRLSILEELLSREAWTGPLLDALAADTVSVRELSAVNRQRLLRHPNPALARRAAELLPNVTESDRAAVVQAHAGAANRKGDRQRGLVLFQDQCANCHAFRGTGHAVGPDLATYRDKPMSEFLVAILDPNSVIEPRFLPYEVETKDGRLLTGVVQDETANSLTLVQGGGLRETLLRSDLLALKPGAFSLMPEGLETALDETSLADLVAYLRSESPRPFQSATMVSAAAAREEFQRTAQPGLGRVLSSSETLTYRSWLGSSPFRMARQTDGEQRVEWETPPVTEGGDPESWVQFDFPVGMGFHSQPAGGFSLWLEGQKAFDFDVELGDARWTSDDLPVRVWYQVRETSPEDSNGILSLAVQRRVLTPGQPVRWTVRAGKADSERWFGLYDVDFTVPLAVPVLPGLRAPADEVAKAIQNEQLGAAERAALIGSNVNQAAEVVKELTRDLENDGAEEYRRIPWLWQLTLQTGRRDDAAELERLLAVSLPAEDAPLAHWQAVVLGGGVVNGLSQVRTDAAARLTQMVTRTPDLEVRWKHALNRSVAMAQDEKVPSGTRYDALRLIALLPWDTARPLLATHLVAGAHPELQQGSVSGLLDVAEPAAAELLVRHWDSLRPGNQKLALDGLLRTESGRRLLARALEEQRIPADALEAEARARLPSSGSDTPSPK